VREGYRDAIAFELVGTYDGDLPTQLRAFATRARRRQPRPGPAGATDRLAPGVHPAHGVPAPRLKRRKTKQVIFFDEVPWLASRRSGFLSAFRSLLEQLGVATAAADRRAVRIGGVVDAAQAGARSRRAAQPRDPAPARRAVRPRRGGRAVARPRRRSRRVPDRRAVHGDGRHPPTTWPRCAPGESAAQNIDRLCFARDGFLRTEFGSLYASLFERAERHEAVVRVLARHRRGRSRTDLLTAAGLGSGGAATKVLDELEESGFITQLPRLGRARRDATYWLADEYSLFYLTWIEPQRATADSVWLRKQGTPAWRAWSGLAFEAMCLKHVPAIKRALGIAGVETVTASWEHRGGDGGDGAQIDLVIDRADRSTNLCEMKFSEAEFVVDKACARDLAHKRDTFRAVTGTRKALFVTLVTAHGVRANEHSRGLVAQDVTLADLFEA
jgi:hypothetical protein